MSENATLGRRLRLGMVGGGRDAFIGGVHRIAARIDDRYELVAGALSSDPEKAKASAADLLLDPSRSYDNFNDMAKAEAGRDDGIDVVAIVTPNHMHYPAAKVFLENRIHVICDKPLTTTIEDAEALEALVQESGLFFGLTHNYTGYPLVRHARDMVAAGEIGTIRVIQVEYPQDWLATKLEETGQKQAQWRTDPTRSGPAGCLGDIGTHAYNIARFVSGLELDELVADLHTFVDGRALDDHVQIMMRYVGGARGMLWSSQVAPGNENALKLRIYGETGGIEWQQENPNTLTYTSLGELPQTLTRGGPGLGAAAENATRVPPGHPEGYLEGFAQIYLDCAIQIESTILSQNPPTSAMLVPTVSDGVDGMRFISRALQSSAAGGIWVKV